MRSIFSALVLVGAAVVAAIPTHEHSSIAGESALMTRNIKENQFECSCDDQGTGVDFYVSIGARFDNGAYCDQVESALMSATGGKISDFLCQDDGIPYYENGEANTLIFFKDTPATGLKVSPGINEALNAMYTNVVDWTGGFTCPVERFDCWGITTRDEYGSTKSVESTSAKSALAVRGSDAAEDVAQNDFQCGCQGLFGLTTVSYKVLIGAAYHDGWYCNQVLSALMTANDNGISNYKCEDDGSGLYGELGGATVLTFDLHIGFIGDGVNFALNDEYTLVRDASGGFNCPTARLYCLWPFDHKQDNHDAGTALTVRASEDIKEKRWIHENDFNCDCKDDDSSVTYTVLIGARFDQGRYCDRVYSALMTATTNNISEYQCKDDLSGMFGNTEGATWLSFKDSIGTSETFGSDVNEALDAMYTNVRDATGGFTCATDHANCVTESNWAS